MSKEPWIQGVYDCPRCGRSNSMIGKHEPCDRAMNFFYYACDQCGAKSSASRPELTLRDLRPDDDE